MREGRSGEVWAAFLPFLEGRQRGGTGRTLLCVNPATAEPIARVVCAGPEEIDAAVESARAAQALWRTTPFEERGRRLLKLADLILDQAEAIASLIALEQGKPIVEALSLEILPALDHLRYIARYAERFHAGEGIEPREPLYAHKRAYYLHDPLGVVALVTPFNLPFALPLVQLGAALAMGNAVLLKPSELTPLCGIRIGELSASAGFPPGLVSVIPTPREDAVRLVAHPGVDKVFVTGTLETGQYVMATAGCGPRPVVLSLGGKHPAIVAADADLDRAARGVVWGALANCGQNCGSVERVFVEAAVARGFVDRVTAAVDALKIGDPLEPGTDVGPLISEARRQEVHRQVTEAVAGGGRVVRGGTPSERSGFFYPPTVVLSAPAASALMREETLGPVIPIVVVDSLERALLLANESDYALTASGWTASAATGERLMSGLKAGVVTINDVLYSFGEPASTWSGYGRSGIGHSHGAAGLREMCRQRFVSFDPKPAEAPLFAFPYDESSRSVALASMTSLHGAGRLRRLRSLVRTVGSRRFRSRIPVRAFLGAWKRRVR